MSYPLVMKDDKEIDRILVFIRDELIRHKDSITGGRTRLVEKSRGEFSNKNLTDFATKYAEPGKNPTIRFTYKILKALLGRPPIRLNEVQPIITVVGNVPRLPPPVPGPQPGRIPCRSRGAGRVYW